MKDWKNKPCYRASSGKGLQARKYELSTVSFLKEKYFKDNVHTNKLASIDLFLSQSEKRDIDLGTLT